MSYVDHSSILQHKFLKLNDLTFSKLNQATPSKRREIEYKYLEQVQVMFTEEEQIYLLETAKRKKWKLPVKGIVSQYIKNGLIFSGMLQVLKEKQTLELPVTEKPPHLRRKRTKNPQSVNESNICLLYTSPSPRDS